MKNNQKRKKKPDLEEINISITNINDILRLYIQCFNKKNNRVEMIENLSTKYKFYNDNKILIDLNNLIKLESAKNQLLELYSEFLKKKNVKQLFNSTNYIFVNSIVDKTNIEHIIFCNEFVFFTSCGFPLIIKTNFDYYIDSYKGDSYNKREDVRINSKHLFTRYCDKRCYAYPEFNFKFNEKTLNDLKTVLFRKEKLKRYKEKEIDLILYEWLQLGLLHHALEIQKQAVLEVDKRKELKILIFEHEMIGDKEDGDEVY
ncbi:hypothetical protein ABK040_004932 [Willaertia magna]